MPTEDEIRLIVPRIDTSIFRFPFKDIRQAYFGNSPRFETRIRIVNDSVSELTRKSGVGRVRDEEPKDIELDVAEFLWPEAPYRVSKRRYLRDGWEVDFFNPPLHGLVLAEFEFPTGVTRVDIPNWLHDTVDVTWSISNSHLARLAGRLELGLVPNWNVLQRVPQVALIGGPCTGKSSIMRTLAPLHPNWKVVPEVATVLMSQLGMDPSRVTVFQNAVYGTQRLFEDASNADAVCSGCEVMTLDRGTLDCGFFIPGGVPELCNLVGTTVQAEFARYKRVIYLEMPSREIYELNRASNPHRRENYEQACHQAQVLKSIWEAHPGFVYVSADTIEVKQQAVERLIQDVATQHVASATPS
jgi:CYTH domain-containing protein